MSTAKLDNLEARLVDLGEAKPASAGDAEFPHFLSVVALPKANTSRPSAMPALLVGIPTVTHPTAGRRHVAQAIASFASHGDRVPGRGVLART